MMAGMGDTGKKEEAVELAQKHLAGCQQACPGTEM